MGKTSSKGRGNQGKSNPAKRKRNGGTLDVLSDDEGSEGSDSDDQEGATLRMLQDQQKVLQDQQKVMAAHIKTLESKTSQKASKMSQKTAKIAAKKGTRDPKHPTPSPAATAQRVTPEKGKGKHPHKDVTGHIHEYARTRLYHSTKFVNGERDIKTASLKTWNALKDKKHWDEGPFFLDYEEFDEVYAPVIRSKLSSFRQSTQTNLKKSAYGKQFCSPLRLTCSPLRLTGRAHPKRLHLHLFLGHSCQNYGTTSEEGVETPFKGWVWIVLFALN